MNRGFKGCHPAVNILFFTGAVIFGMLFQHPVCLAVSFLASLTYYIRLKGKEALHSLVVFLLPMLILVTIINGLFSHYGVTELFTLFSGNSVTFESLAYGFVTGLTVVNVILWFFCYNEVVTTDKFLYLFGRHLPSAALIVSMALRFIPMYRERYRIISDAQKGIGFAGNSGGLTQRIRNSSKSVSILITWALENAIETSDSMRSRGYNTRKRNNYSRYERTAADTVIMIFLTAMLAVFIACSVTGSLKCLYNPQVMINPNCGNISYFISEINLTYNPLSAYGIITLTAYSIYCFLPLIIDFKEDMKWNKL